MKTAVKERPILFSGEMVRAVLAGRKTMTRRVIKPQPPSVELVRKKSGSGYKWYRDPDAPPEWPWRPVGPVWAVRELNIEMANFGIHCPYGAPGERLWVRETWARSRNNWLYASSAVSGEGPQGDTDDWDWDASIPNRWRPSIFMPRAASRITLEVTAVRVERLQEMDDWDAIDEGVDDPWWHKSYRNSDGDFIEPEGVAVEAFRELWDRINVKRDGCSWESNPWVWVIAFRQVKETP